MRLEAACTLTPTTASVPAARHFVARTLRQWKCGEDVASVAMLLASEVVTNAIVHARSNAFVRVQLTDGVLRVEVHDATRQLPTPRPHDPHAESGRGLMLVDAYSSVWGTSAAGDGKVVWFEVPSETSGHEMTAGDKG
jgi:anti-sigma regulatory factor (Ser/Thr protein kinase)